MADFTKGQENFIEQYTRKLLVEWSRIWVQSIYEGVTPRVLVETKNAAFADLAAKKGWVNYEDGWIYLVKGVGFDRATAFLRR